MQEIYLTILEIKTDHIEDKIVYYRDNDNFNEARPHRE